jgi:uncharacterized protein YukE
MRGAAAVADESETTGTETDTAPSTAELAGRIDGIESKLDLLIDKIGGKKDEAHAAAQQHTEDRLDRPSSIAEEIRAQIAAAKAAEAADAEKRGQADRLAAVEAAVTGMAEKAPEAPLRRVEKLMGWR